MIIVNKIASAILAEAIKQLPHLIEQDGWSSYYIDAEEPIVERLWHPIEGEWESWRVCLHRIQNSAHAFYHPHRHPSAILICKGSYEMGVGYGDPDGPPPPIFGPIMMRKGNAYQMTDPNNWHYIRTLVGPVYSIMVTGEPYQKDRVVNRPKPRPLTDEEANRIFDFFKTADLNLRLPAESFCGTLVSLGSN